MSGSNKFWFGRRRVMKFYARGREAGRRPLGIW